MVVVVDVAVVVTVKYIFTNHSPLSSHIRFFEYEVIRECYGFSSTGAPLADVRHGLTKIGKKAVYRKFLHSYFIFVFVCVIPLLTMAVLNVYLMQAVRVRTSIDYASL